MLVFITLSCISVGKVIKLVSDLIAFKKMFSLKLKLAQLLYFCYSREFGLS